MTTKRKTREWFGGAIENLIELCRRTLHGEESVETMMELMQEIELVEKVTGQSVLDALPRKRGRSE